MTRTLEHDALYWSVVDACKPYVDADQLERSAQFLVYDRLRYWDDNGCYADTNGDYGTYEGQYSELRGRGQL